MFGLLVYTIPIPATIISLVLYIGATAIFAYLAPETLLQGVIFKVLIIAGLIKAVQSAIAYDNDRKNAAKSGAAA